MLQTNNPLFSIITVTYNAAPNLERTLRSVVGQSFDDFESIIIDGASTDYTNEVVNRLKSGLIRFYSEPDNGIYDAMNKGLARAKGKYVLFLNAGDCFHSADTLRMVAEAIHANNFPGVVYGQTDIVNSEGQRIGPRHLTAPPLLTVDSFKQGMVVCHQAFFVLREITSEYHLKYRFSADYDWCIRCLQKSRSNIYVDAVLIDYLNEGATTANHRASLIERFKIMSHYYGTLPTIWRHITFIARNL